MADFRDWPDGLEPLRPGLLDRYLAFTGAPRPDHPTLEALSALATAHLQSIPFENLDAMLGREVSLEHGALVDKLCSGVRGGYCYEHNVLFAAALRALGFDVALLATRTVLNADSPRPRTHLSLRVRIGGVAYLADVGFGFTAMRGPLLLRTGPEQRLVDHRFRLVDVAGEVLVEVLPDADGADAWRPQYVVDPRPVFMVDIDVANHFVWSHPASAVRQRVIVLRAGEQGKRAIAGRRLIIDEPGRQEVRELEPADLGAVLQQEFGIALPAPLAVLPA